MCITATFFMLNNESLLYSITTSQQDEQNLATLNNTAAFVILKLVLNYPPKAPYFLISNIEYANM